MSITVLVSFERAVEKSERMSWSSPAELRRQRAYGEKQRLDVGQNLRRTQSEPGASYSLEGRTMPKLAIWVEMEAKAGKEQEVADFLKSAQALAEKEQGTITWYAIKMGGPKFGIFDTFAEESGREAHLNGEIAKALFAKAPELLAKEPQVHRLELLAAKVPGVGKAKTA
jgi:quinol monooxygenase YgiN